jgi:hypothetical protein
VALCYPRAAIVHKQQRGRSHVQVQKRLAGHLVIGWRQGEVLTYRMNVTHATLQRVPNERRAMTPLFWGHVNPYGTFQLDMTARLPLDPPMSAGIAGQLSLRGD